MKRERVKKVKGEGVEIFSQRFILGEKILPDLDFLKGERTFIVRENGKEEN